MWHVHMYVYCMCNSTYVHIMNSVAVGGGYFIQEFNNNNNKNKLRSSFAQVLESGDQYSR